MKKLSYTQADYLCVINKKGKMPSLKATDISACLLASAIIELKENGYIEADGKKKFSAVKPWDNALPYLKPVYDSVAAARKPQAIKSIASPFLFGRKSMRMLLQAIGKSLAEQGCAVEIERRGLINDKIWYAPHPMCAKGVIAEVRAEFLSEGIISDASICLGALLDKSGLVRRYFSSYEAGALKLRLKQIRKSEVYATAKIILDYVNTITVVVATSGISAST